VTQATDGRGLQARPDRADAHQLVDLDGRLDTPHRYRAEIVDLHEALGQAVGIGRDANGAGRGELFHARGQVRGRSHRRVVHAEIRADGAHHHLAGVEADADPDLHAVSAPHLVGVAADGVLDAQRGVAGAHGVVLVGELGSEQRHDAVAHDLVHRALVAVDGVHHELEHGIEDLSRGLGVAIGDELHRTLHVCEEHRDLLALAFQCGLRRQDPLGEVAGDLRRGRRRQRGAALLAELRPGAVLVLAPGTCHPRPPPAPGAGPARPSRGAIAPDGSRAAPSRAWGGVARGAGAILP
jgi:hypothetical protein